MANFTEAELAEFRRQDAEQAAADAAYTARIAAEEASRYKAGWWAVDKETGKAEPVPGWQNNWNRKEPERVERQAYREGLRRPVRWIGSAEAEAEFRQEVSG